MNDHFNLAKELIEETMITSNDVSKISGEKAKVYIASEGEYYNFSKRSIDATDYAFACGLKPRAELFPAALMLRDTRLTAAEVFCMNLGLDSLSTAPISDGSLGIMPMLTLNLEKFLKYKDSIMANGMVTLGEWPGVEMNLFSVVEEYERMYSNKEIQPTGNKWLGAYGELNDEYEIKGKKYVRIKKPIQDKGIREPSAPAWFCVKPIRWVIENWKDMPTEINPLGSGTAKNVVLRSERVLIAGLPYGDDKRGAPSRLNQCHWAINLVGKFLNGANEKVVMQNPVTREINEIDLQQFNFLNMAFDYNQQKVHAVSAQDNEVKMTKTFDGEIDDEYEVSFENETMTVNEQIKFYIDNGKSFMLHGPSGVGKTRRVEEADPDFVSIVLRNGMLPEEVIGKTIFPNNDTSAQSVWMPPAWYDSLCKKCKEEPEKNHVLFIDEITNVKPAEQSLVFHLVLNRSIGPNIGQLPENVVVVAAGNNKQESESAYNMPEPLFRRFEGHIYLEANLKDFLEWGMERRKDGKLKIHPLVARFLISHKEDAFYSEYDSEDPPKHAIDPRGWEQVSDLIYANKGKLSQELLANKMGSYLAGALIAFARVKHISLGRVLKGDFHVTEIPGDIFERQAIAAGLLMANEEQIDVVHEFVEKYLGREVTATFDSKWVGDSAERAILIEGLKQHSIFSTKVKNEKDKETSMYDSVEPSIEDLNNAKEALANSTRKNTGKEFWWNNRSR